MDAAEKMMDGGATGPGTARLLGSGSRGVVVFAGAARAGRAPVGSWHSAWTIPMLCAGLGLIACCILVPAADENRRMVWQRAALQADLQQVDRQMTVNEEFLHRVATDPTMAQRLAERQMRAVPEGQSVLDLGKDAGGADRMSPFPLVLVPAPPTPAAYEPAGGLLGRLACNAQLRLMAMGAALMLVAAGLVLGAGPSGRE